MKTILLISGFDIDETAMNMPAYVQIGARLERKGNKVVLVDIGWRRKLPSHYAR